MRVQFVFAILLALVIAPAAMASGAAPGHHLHHDEFYSTLKRPGTDQSCCDDRDCRPGVTLYPNAERPDHVIDDLKELTDLLAI